MAAATENLNLTVLTTYYDLYEFPVAAGKIIYKNTLVGLNASGYAARLSGTALKFAGLAYASANNLSGSAGDVTAKVYGPGTVVEFPVSSLSSVQANVGDAFFASADNIARGPALSSGRTYIGRGVGVGNRSGYMFISTQPVWANDEKTL